MKKMDRAERLKQLQKTGGKVNIATKYCLVKGRVEEIDEQNGEITIVEVISSIPKIEVANFHYVEIDAIEVISEQKRIPKKKGGK